MPERHAPAASRRKLGILLRQLREGCDLTGEQVAKQLRVRSPKIYRVEGGKVVPTHPELTMLMDLYQVTDEHREVLLQLADEARRKGWYESYESVLPPKFETYVGLESDATALRAYEPSLVHGLLQTRDYAHAVLTAGNPAEHPDDIELLVDLRMRRQELLTREHDPLRFWVVLEEVVLHRPVGGAQVLTEQLRHLLTVAADLPNVTVQIIPTAVGAHAGLAGSFSILEFEPSSPEVIYVDSHGGNLTLEKTRDLRRCKLLYDNLVADALSKRESTRLVEAALEDTRAS
ncbi:helix-turn-helix domain-containing protein [Nocardiopsis sp. NPDC050513]|uniref:helix-turn-helix domain-containing protein n=1 Tax=Nocardiopsis sp. NPDC050513 TaxID=3364338 RepID=UPI0037A5ABA5